MRGCHGGNVKSSKKLPSRPTTDHKAAVTILAMPPKSGKPKEEQPRVYVGARRDRRGMTQEELAAEMDVDKGTVSRWESFKRTPDNAMVTRLAKFFGCKFEDMFYPPDALAPPLGRGGPSSPTPIDIPALAAEVAKHINKTRRR